MVRTHIHTQDAQQKKTQSSKVPQGDEGRAEPGGRPQQETFGGYDCEFVEPPTSAFQTECPICNLILRDPYQFTCCGTNFCHSCSERLQAEHKHCPTCREDNFELFANKSLKRSLAQLYVLCTHSKGGCTWKGELGELEQHLSEVVHSGGFSLKWIKWMIGSILSRVRNTCPLKCCHKLGIATHDSLWFGVTVAVSGVCQQISALHYTIDILLYFSYMYCVSTVSSLMAYIHAIKLP